MSGETTLDTPVKSAASVQAYNQIRQDIVSGALKEHERLTEQALAEQLGLSRTPVREALKRLIHEGFLERQSGYSTRVAQFSNDETEQIFQLRQMLEGYAIKRAATLATEQQISTLRDLANYMSERVPTSSSNDYDEIAQANENFHRTIYEAADSPRLIALLSVAIDVGLVARTYRLYSAQALRRSCQHHHEMVDAISARSPEWAASVMSSHIMAAQAAAAAVNHSQPTIPSAKHHLESTR
jgi:DNA-binding GntR family transcriptional regulator